MVSSVATTTAQTAQQQSSDRIVIDDPTKFLTKKGMSKAERKAAQELIGHPDGYPTWQPPVCLVTNLYAMYVVGMALRQGDTTLLVVAFIAAATYMFTDVISGLLHIVLDNPNFLGSPIDELCRGFQEHHLDTTLICRLSLFDHLRVMCFPLVIVFAVGVAVNGAGVQFLIYYICLTWALFYMQMCHRWAHMHPSNRGAIVDWLQGTGLALPPSVHLQHHSPPFEHTFCIMNGWFNPMLNRIVKVGPLHPHKMIWAPLFLSAALTPHFFMFLVC